MIELSLVHAWLVLAVLLFIFEVFTLTVVSLCLGAACGCTALASAAGFSFQAQMVTFSLGVIVSLFTLRPLLKRFIHRGPGHQTNVHALVGKTGIVVEPVSADCAGRVRVAGEDWRALPAAAQGEYCLNEKVTVSHIEGATLYIQPVPQTVI